MGWRSAKYITANEARAKLHELVSEQDDPGLEDLLNTLFGDEPYSYEIATEEKVEEQRIEREGP